MADGSEKRVTVVVAVDKSKEAEEAFNWYATTIYRSDHKVVLVHSPEGPTVRMSEGMHLPAGEWEKVKSSESTETDEMLAKYTQKMKDTGINHTEYKTVYGYKPGEAIVKASKDVGATFIVMGTRGMGTIRRTIMGSVSNYVLHHAAVPVIVCRQPGK